MMRTLAFVVMLLPAVASAQPAKETGTMVTDDCARARAVNKTCVLDMTGVEIDGVPVKPDGSDVDARGFGKFASLIRIRREFIGEILKSAQDL
jgi:hypothetical protein